MAIITISLVCTFAPFYQCALFLIDRLSFQLTLFHACFLYALYVFLKKSSLSIISFPSKNISHSCQRISPTNRASHTTHAPKRLTGISISNMHRPSFSPLPLLSAVCHFRGPSPYCPYQQKHWTDISSQVHQNRHIRQTYNSHCYNNELMA